MARAVPAFRGGGWRCPPDDRVRHLIIASRRLDALVWAGTAANRFARMGMLPVKNATAQLAGDVVAGSSDPPFGGDRRGAGRICPLGVQRRRRRGGRGAGGGDRDSGRRLHALAGTSRNPFAATGAGHQGRLNRATLRGAEGGCETRGFPPDDHARGGRYPQREILRVRSRIHDVGLHDRTRPRRRACRAIHRVGHAERRLRGVGPRGRGSAFRRNWTRPLEPACESTAGASG